LPDLSNLLRLSSVCLSMKKACLLFTIFFLTTFNLYSQDVEITGQIINKTSQEALPYVHIVNETSQKGTVSNTAGRFWMKMSRTDTLLFSAIGFEKYVFTLNEDITTDKLDIKIELDLATMELEAVDVFAFRNERALKDALINMDVPLAKNEEFRIPGVKRSAPKTTKPEPGFSLGSPLTSIAKVFSKEEKEKKLLKKYKTDYEYQKLITSKFNRQVVMEITNVPEDKVEDFMKFCVLEDSFIHRATEYELAVVLKQCEIDFEKTLNDSPE